ncbi:MAG: hypothetical protein WCD63_17250 [Terrimicrobiaceae bacterium]
MKVFTLKPVATFLAGILAATIPTARAQSPAQSVGTLSGLGPDTIVVRSMASGELVRYFSSQTTVYVDEAGAPLISIDSLKAGVPVTVQYIKIVDQLVASRVSVGKSSTDNEIIRLKDLIQPAARLAIAAAWSVPIKGSFEDSILLQRCQPPGKG